MNNEQQLNSKNSAIHALTWVVLFMESHIGNRNDARAQREDVRYDEAKVPKYTLPDPLVTSDGSKVTSVDIWRTKRRPELLALFKEHVYGTMPPPKKIAHVDIQAFQKEALGGMAICKELTLLFNDDRSRLRINVLIFMPKRTNDSAFPAFLGYNFNGNHTVHAEKNIRMNEVWLRELGSKPYVPVESTRGAMASRWQIEKIVSRGYALVTVYYGDVDPDFHDNFANGIHVF